MKVYSLTGRSGTGKSFQAINLCNEKGIESIIDDGLFIYRDRVEAGISAKRQKTMVGAIKTALFTDDEHAGQVIKRIGELKPSALLIIGTSDRMIDKIIARLRLPPISERIYIEDITSEEERMLADKQRNVQGKHVIPVPTLQLKRDFAGYFLDPMRIFKERSITGKAGSGEKTVVRPTFSYMGEFYISDTVLTDIAVCVGKETDGVADVMGVYENTEPDNLMMRVAVAVDKKCRIWETAQEFQEKLAEVIETMTAFNVVRLDVEITDVV